MACVKWAMTIVLSFHRLLIFRPDAVMLAAQRRQEIPAVKPAVMAVVEQDAHGVIAHRLQRADRDLLLGAHDLLGPAMAAHFRRRAFHPQIFGGKRETFA